MRYGHALRSGFLYGLAGAIALVAWMEAWNQWSAQAQTATPSNFNTKVAAGSSSLLLKSSAATLTGANVVNGTTPGVLVLNDSAAVPASSAATSPLKCYNVGASASFDVARSVPLYFANGAVLLFSSSCTTYTPVTPVFMSGEVR